MRGWNENTDLILYCPMCDKEFHIGFTIRRTLNYLIKNKYIMHAMRDHPDMGPYERSQFAENMREEILDKLQEDYPGGLIA